MQEAGLDGPGDPSQPCIPFPARLPVYPVYLVAPALSKKYHSLIKDDQMLQQQLQLATGLHVSSEFHTLV